MQTVILIILLSIIFPFIFKSTDTLDVENSNDEIVFAFNNRLKMTILLCTILCILLSIVTLIIGYTVDKEGIAISIVMAILALLIMLFYLLLRNKKIIYKDKFLHVYNILGKEKKFNIEDVTNAIENSSDGIKLYFKDNKKIKVDVQMTNYTKIKDILDENGIAYKDNHGNNSPKGW